MRTERLIRSPTQEVHTDTSAFASGGLGNGGVSLATIRKHLGHASVVTTTRYAEQADGVADADLRAWRRAQR